MLLLISVTIDNRVVSSIKMNWILGEKQPLRISLSVRIFAVCMSIRPLCLALLGQGRIQGCARGGLSLLFCTFLLEMYNFRTTLRAILGRVSDPDPVFLPGPESGSGQYQTGSETLVLGHTSFLILMGVIGENFFPEVTPSFRRRHKTRSKRPIDA